MSSQNRIAVVSGGMGGIGTAICQKLAAEGATVVALAHTSEEEQVPAWQAENGDFEVLCGDVADTADAARMMAAVNSLTVVLPLLPVIPINGI